jgi:hypothetical protein
LEYFLSAGEILFDFLSAHLCLNAPAFEAVEIRQMVEEYERNSEARRYPCAGSFVCESEAK